MDSNAECFIPGAPEKMDGFQRHIFYIIIKFTELCFSICNLYTVPFAAKISLLSNSIRVNGCQHILMNVPPTTILLTSDEAHFHLTGCVNKQNFRYCAEANPHELHERPLHSDRVKVYCAVGEFGVLGPYFFKDNGSAVTITPARYIEMLENFLRPLLMSLLLMTFGSNKMGPLLTQHKEQWVT